MEKGNWGWLGEQSPSTRANAQAGMKWRCGDEPEGRERQGGGIVWIPNMCPGNPNARPDGAGPPVFGNHSIRLRDVKAEGSGKRAAGSALDVFWTLPPELFLSIPLNKRASPHNCACVSA